MLKIKNSVTEIKNAFDGLVSSLETAEERLFELQDLSVKTFKTKKQKVKSLKKQTEYLGMF